jgi:hypothetical protein
VVDDVEARVAGMPRRWFRPKVHQEFDNRWVRHPVDWLRWRLQVRRHGPFAPTFDAYRRRRG